MVAGRGLSAGIQVQKEIYDWSKVRSGERDRVLHLVGDTIEGCCVSPPVALATTAATAARGSRTPTEVRVETAEKVFGESKPILSVCEWVGELEGTVTEGG